MSSQIPNDLEQAVTAHPEGAIKLQGAHGIYWIMTDAAMQIRAAVQEGLDQADRGDVEPWDSEEIKRAGRQRQQARSQDA